MILKITVLKRCVFNYMSVVLVKPSLYTSSRSGWVPALVFDKELLTTNEADALERSRARCSLHPACGRAWTLRITLHRQLV